MSIINRNNYESIFLDYHEGNLSASDIDQLMLFIEQNEDLQEELFSFQSLELVSTEEKFEANSKLKNPDGISENEALIIKNIEGKLNQNESVEFSKLLAQDISFKNEKIAYDKTILVKEDVMFTSKKELRQTQKVVPVLISTLIILIISTFIFYPYSTNEVKRHYFKTNRDVSQDISFPVSTPTLIKQEEQTKPQPVILPIKKGRQTKSAAASKPKSHPTKLELKASPIVVSTGSKIASPALENKISIKNTNVVEEKPFLKPKEMLVKSLDKKINGKSSVPTSNISSFLEKTIEKVTKKETKINSSNTKNRKQFSIKIGRFEYSNNKRK